jgi:hypothetical protein
MTRYLIFKNSENSGMTNVPGSAQAVACDIARTVEMMGNAAKDFVAYPDDSSEAKVESLKALQMFAVELDQQKIDRWINHAEPLLELIDNVQDALGNAYSMIASAVQDLESHCESSELFSGLDLTSDMDIDRAFEYIENPSEEMLVEKITELFDVKSFEVTG